MTKEEIKELSTKEIAKLIREDLKKYWKDYKFSVITELYSWWSAIDLYIVKAPFTCKGKNECIYTNFWKKLMEELKEIILKYTINNSNPYEDYYDINFYWNISLHYEKFIDSDTLSPLDIE